MTELLSLPDLPANQVGSAQLLVAAPGSGGAVAYKVALASYFTAPAVAASYAPLASPMLTGMPAAPTANPGTSTTQLATTAFVTGAIGTLATVTVRPAADPLPLTSAAVTVALGYTPYDATNPTAYITAAALSAYASVASVTTTLGGYLTQATADSRYQTAAQVAASVTAGIASSTTAIAGLAGIYAPLSSPTFTGAPVVPGYLATAAAASMYQPLLGFTPYSAGNPASYIAASGAPVQSVAGRSGAVVLAVSDVAGAQTGVQVAAAVASGTAANVSGLVALANGGTGATTAAAARSALGLAAVATSGAYADLTGPPAAYSLPTASAAVLGGVKVDGITVTIAGGVLSAAAPPVQSVAGRSGAVTLGVADVAGAAPLASPVLTGTPTVPGYLTTVAAAAAYQAALGFTPYNATNPAGYLASTTAASTYATAVSVPVAASSVPAANGTAAAGVAVTFARADHVHPTDATRAPLASPALTGTPSAPTAAAATNTTQLATTAFVTAAVAAGGGGGSSTVPVSTVAASGASQVLAAAASGSKAYDITLTAACTLTLSGGTAGQQQSVTAYLRQDATAGRVATLPSGVRWVGGVAPTPNTAAGVIDVFVFTTPDAGTTWFGGY